MSEETVSYKDFKKLEFRVGTIKTCEPVQGSDKLFRIQVEMGDETRQIISGLRQYYEAEEMEGKRIVVVVNLKPAKIFGQTSNGMLLAAETRDGDLALLTTDKEIANGARVS